MSDIRTIAIEFSKGAVLTDVCAQLSALARTIELSSNGGGAEAAESVRVLAGYINSPSDNVIRPTVARAFTEGYDHVKAVCQRYLVFGRTEDDNRLESIIEGEVVTVYMGTPTTAGPLGSFTPDAGVRYKITMEGMGTTEAIVVLAYNGKDVPLTGSNPSCEIDGVVDGGVASFTFDAHEIPANEIVLTADSTAYAVLTLELGMPGNFNIAMTSAIKSFANKILVDYILSQVLRYQRPDDSGALLKSVEYNKVLLLKALSARNTFTRSHHDWA